MINMHVYNAIMQNGFYLLFEKNNNYICFKMADTLSPFVFWGQTKDAIILKIDLKDVSVSASLRTIYVAFFWKLLCL